MDSNTGVVSLVNTHSLDQSSSYLLNISVSDGVHSSTTKVRINLVSANSFTPTFEKSIFEVNFAENQAKGVQVHVLSNFLKYSVSENWTYSEFGHPKNTQFSNSFLKTGEKCLDFRHQLCYLFR